MTESWHEQVCSSHWCDYTDFAGLPQGQPLSTAESTGSTLKAIYDTAFARKRDARPFLLHTAPIPLHTPGSRQELHSLPTHAPIDCKHYNCVIHSAKYRITLLLNTHHAAYNMHALHVTLDRSACCPTLPPTLLRRTCCQPEL